MATAISWHLLIIEVIYSLHITYKDSIYCVSLSIIGTKYNEQLISYHHNQTSIKTGASRYHGIYCVIHSTRSSLIPIMARGLIGTYSFFNTLRPRQNGCHFADDSLKCIFVNENIWIATKISLKFVPKGPINNIPALIQIVAWRQSDDKPLSEPMMVGLPTHIYMHVTWPQYVKASQYLPLYSQKKNVRFKLYCLLRARPLIMIPEFPSSKPYQVDAVL